MPKKTDPRLIREIGRALGYAVAPEPRDDWHSGGEWINGEFVRWRHPHSMCRELDCGCDCLHEGD